MTNVVSIHSACFNVFQWMSMFFQFISIYCTSWHFIAPAHSPICRHLLLKLIEAEAAAQCKTSWGDAPLVFSREDIGVDQPQIDTSAHTPCTLVYALIHTPYTLVYTRSHLSGCSPGSRWTWHWGRNKPASAVATHTQCPATGRGVYSDNGLK